MISGNVKILNITWEKMTGDCCFRCYYSFSSTVPLGFLISKEQYAAAVAAGGVPAAVAAVDLSPSELDAG
jgi:hypothetical protein